MHIQVPCHQFTLENGLNVILHEDHSVPIVAVNIWYHVGSSRERPGRTGFAHLFEHLMFEGSRHVPRGAFDEWLESAGGTNNGSTDEDRTNYYETLPANGLELALFLESDRMGYLLDAMTPEKLDAQRDVVKNERRQTSENQPYGMAELALPSLVFPPDHPYHWPVIGSMEDLSAASYEDVVDFFRCYYTPRNASLVLAGDIDVARARELVAKWFGEVPPGKRVEPIERIPAHLAGERIYCMEDRVQLPRLYLVWLSPPHFAPGDAELDLAGDVLSVGKSSRLYRRLVYEMEVAQEVAASQYSRRLASLFVIQVTGRAGQSLAELRDVVDEEVDKLAREEPDPRELERAYNQLESAFLEDMERVARKADHLNGYYFYTGKPDSFEEDLARYRVLSPEDVRAAARRYLNRDRVLLAVVPEKARHLALDDACVIEPARTE